LARILLVDDDAAVRLLLETVLRTGRHEVTTAIDGRGALAAVATDTFDVVITDLIMPDMEGIETIMELRRIRPACKIIAMSGGGRGSADDYLDIAANVGAHMTLAKPFSPQQLLDAVQQVLGA
jgi:CheY-like chemotaxis protein